MTIQEAVEKLLALENTTDQEISHIDAEGILLDFLRSNGFAEVADAYDEISDAFWYA